ncbi:MAG: zinc ribbon domain-containing protein [Candidatus Buchananbacteria bacterium]|nr:zinc ribbon domain-containing protein [Candidatus Buchananbacteria bacterium]
MFCSRCGLVIEKNSRFCGGCGVKVKQIDDVASTPKDSTVLSKNKDDNNSRRTWKMFMIIFIIVLLLQSRSIYINFTESNGLVGFFGEIVGYAFLAIIITMIFNKVVFSKKNKK